MDWNATSLIVLAAASLVVGAASLWLVRRQPHEAQQLMRDALEPHKGRRGPGAILEPNVRVSYGEFYQVRKGGDETDKVIRYEATSNFRLLLANHGEGRALSVRVKATCTGMTRPNWTTSGWVDIPPGGERDVILRSMILPPLGTEEVTWVHAPVRLEYLDSLGREWYTETPVRLKFMRSEGSDSYALWWVDVLEPQEHGQVEAAREEHTLVGAIPVAAVSQQEPAAAEPKPSEELPIPFPNKGHEWVSSPRRPRTGDAAAAAGL